MRAEEKYKSYQCHVCDRHFSSKNSLKVHFETHDSFKTYNCKDCGALFHTQGSYYVHIRSHSNNYLVCQYCGKTFHHNDKFKCHLRTHTGEKPYFCTNCPKTFASRDNLKRHEILVHKNDRDFECRQCSEKFVFYQNYLDHLQCHKKEESLKCDICKKTLKSKSMLVRHLRTHTGKKPFKCEICSARFSDPSNRKRHMKTHEQKNQLQSSQSENLNSIIPSQNQIKTTSLLTLDLRNPEMKLFLLINPDHQSLNDCKMRSVVKKIDSFQDYLYEPMKPGHLIEDSISNAESDDTSCYSKDLTLDYYIKS